MAKEKTEILLTCKDTVFVNKPAGVSIPEVYSALDASGIETGQLQPIGNPDPEASGIVILSGNELWASKSTDSPPAEITSLVLVNAITLQQEGVIETLITQNRKDYHKMTVTSRRGKKAVTRWELLAEFGAVSLLKIRPLTARRHQIRVHLPHRSMPLAVDKLYGSKRGIYLSDIKRGYRPSGKKKESPLIERLTVHTYQAELTAAPREKGCPGKITAPLDKKFAAAIKMLTKHGEKGRDAFLDQKDFERLMSGRPI